jgi:integrase
VTGGEEPAGAAIQRPTLSLSPPARVCAPRTPALCDLTAAHIQQLHADLLTAGLSTYTVAGIHTLLSSAVGQTVREEVISRNVAKVASTICVNKREFHPHSPEAFRHIVAVNRADPHLPLWILLITTGLRVGEALALHWADVDLLSGRLFVRRSLRRIRGLGVMELPPKSPGAARTVPPSPLVW